MRLCIKKRKGVGFKLWLPTSLLKSKFLIRAIKKHADEDPQPFIDVLPTLYKQLKEYTKKNGRFALVEIEDADGDKIFIQL